MHLDPLVLPDDWTPEQAVIVAEFLIALHDAIWDGYGGAIRTEGSSPPPSLPPVPVQLDLPFAATAASPSEGPTGLDQPSPTATGAVFTFCHPSSPASLSAPPFHQRA